MTAATLGGEPFLLRTSPFRCDYVNDPAVTARRGLMDRKKSIVTLDEDVLSVSQRMLSCLLTLEQLTPAHTKVYGRPSNKTRLTLAENVAVVDAFDMPRSLPKSGQWVFCEIMYSLAHDKRPGRAYTPRTRLPVYFIKRIHRMIVL